MQILKFFRLAAICFLLPLGSCGSDNSNQANTTETSGGDASVAPLPSAAPATPEMQAAPAPGNANAATAAAPAPGGGGVQHYTCPKNCKGSGGPAAGNCPVCGTAYVHNAAFHGQAGTPPPATATPAGATPNPAQPTPSPAKNAAGVYHYTCAKGCAGGAGSAGKCATCGGDLAHNAAYHQ